MILLVHWSLQIDHYLMRKKESFIILHTYKIQQQWRIICGKNINLSSSPPFCAIVRLFSFFCIWGSIWKFGVTETKRSIRFTRENNYIDLFTLFSFLSFFFCIHALVCSAWENKWINQYHSVKHERSTYHLIIYSFAINSDESMKMVVLFRCIDNYRNNSNLSSLEITKNYNRFSIAGVSMKLSKELDTLFIK